jgi:hypothetical protein
VNTEISFSHAFRRLGVLLAACALWLNLSGMAAGHQLDPAVVTATVLSDRVEFTIRDAFEPMIAIARVKPTSDADADRVNAIYDELRKSGPLDFDAALRSNWTDVAAYFTVFAGDTRLTLELTEISVPVVADPKQLRFSTIKLTAALPKDGTPVRFGWRSDFGPFSIHQTGGDGEGYTEILQGGQLSQPMPRSAPLKEGVATVFSRFVTSGFEHIVPKGLDHILFVLGLFFYSLRLRPLLAQVTAFTLAHSVSLALASLKIVSLPASVVEPFIALSIVYVAVENIVFGRRGTISYLRVAVVFCFGLLHGLGFASVLQDVGLPAGQFAVGLIGFNVGVEFGQIFVILIAYALLGLPFGRKSWYRSGIVIPASVGIAAMGVLWTVERLVV